MASSLRATMAVFLKDLGIWLRQPVTIAASILPPLVLLLVEALGAVSVGRSPVALVVQDNGPAADRVVAALQDADVFRIQRVDAAAASRLMESLGVVAVVTVPRGFSDAVGAGAPTSLEVRINNLNLDFTNDIRRAVPDAVTRYFASLGDTSPIRISVQESDLRARDIEMFQYSVVPTIVFLLMISALISGGLATTREWESLTVKELLLAPVRPAALVAGKVLAGWMTSFSLGLLVLVAATALGWVYPAGISWLTAALVIALISLFGASLGVALGAAIRRVQAMIITCILVTLYLFFLGGGLGVLAFEPEWLQAVASFVPLTYGIHALQMALFYDSADALLRDVAVLAGVSLAALAAGSLSLRRKLVG